MFTNNFKKMMINNWKDEVEVNQRTLYDLMIELENLDYYDK